MRHNARHQRRALNFDDKRLAGRYTADDLPPINELYQRKLVGDFRGGVIYLKPHSRGVAYDIDPFDLQ